MLIASEIKNAVSLKDVLQEYGIKVNSSGFALCPFHREKTPSFKVHDDHYYCFGCNASGDVIDFVQSYFGLAFLDSLKKINQDFSLGMDDDDRIDYQEIEEIKQLNQRFSEAIFKEKQQEREVYNMVCEMIRECRNTINSADSPPEKRIKAFYREMHLNAILDDWEDDGILLRVFTDLWKHIAAAKKERIQSYLEDSDIDQIFSKMREYIFRPDVQDHEKPANETRKKEKQKWAKR